MGRKQYREEQIAFALGQAESGTPVAERRVGRVHYGYPRLWGLLRREGWLVNKQLVYRLYCGRRPGNSVAKATSAKERPGSRGTSAKRAGEREREHGFHSVFVGRIPDAAGRSVR